MPNLQQAPAIKYSGEKNKDSKGMGKAIRTHELESAIMCGLGDRDMAMMKIMFFLTGNGEGFKVAEKTICERCNMSESGYKKARKKLVDMGWISLIPGEAIIVNYDAIYCGKGITEKTSSNENEKSKGITENTSLGITEKPSQGITQNTYNNISNNIIEQNNGCDDVPEVEEITMDKFKEMYSDCLVLVNTNFYETQGILKIFDKTYKIKK